MSHNEVSMPGSRNSWFWGACPEHGRSEHLSMFLPGNACMECKKQREALDNSSSCAKPG
jgi:hypothetical protein